ncbi:MAG: hypothetical protein ACP5PW_03850 [Candidatus Dormibacteria bacterium]
MTTGGAVAGAGATPPEVLPPPAELGAAPPLDEPDAVADAAPVGCELRPGMALATAAATAAVPAMAAKVSHTVARRTRDSPRVRSRWLKGGGSAMGR